MKKSSSYIARESGVELLKIISLFLIVISHVTMTLGGTSLYVKSNDFVIPLGIATKDIQVLILNLFRQAGFLGNIIFFVCSSWYLVGREGNSRKKAFELIISIWVVSVIFCGIYLAIIPSVLQKYDIIKQFLPTCFGNNWYLTCYIIFLFIYPYLNKFISVIDQSEHKRIVIFTSILWIIVNYVKCDLFFQSRVLSWISIYFLISYLKMYCKEKMESKKIGYLLLGIGILGYILQVLLSNIAGLYFIKAFSDKILRWNSDSCPFYIMIALGALILARQHKYKSVVINYISGLTMFIYLIHENYLFREYTRPKIWEWIYNITNGYDSKIVLIDLAFSLALLMVSAVVSCLYKETLQKFVIKVSDEVYEKLFTRIRKES